VGTGNVPTNDELLISVCAVLDPGWHKGRRNTRSSKSARRATDTDRKSLLALRGVGPESEAESVRFHGRRLTKVGPEVKQGLFRVAGRVRNPKNCRRGPGRR
jgi:hypothetical protein